MTIKLAIVISHPIQHFAPMFRDLSKRPEVDLKVFYCCDWGVREYKDPGFGTRVEWDIPLLEGYEHEFLAIRNRPDSLSFREIDNPDVCERLEAFGAQAVWIHGYSHRTSWRVWRWARNRAYMLYFGDSELLHHRPLKSRLLKRLILPFFFRRIDAFITIGDNNELYYRHYGVPFTKMFRGAFPVDINRFQAAAQKLTAADRAEIRVRYGLSPEAIVVLFVGKFISIKKPLDLVEAIALLKKRKKPDIQALFIGSGELEGQIKDRVRTLNVEDQVKFSGFVNQSEIPAVLSAGDILAMCSEKDPHPLAVTESMAVGNVVVASDKVGCVGPTDAARPGANALVYPVGDTSRLADCISLLVARPALRRGMSSASLDLSFTQDTNVAVAAVLHALHPLTFGSQQPEGE